jgi:hypothetical protein
MDVSAHANWHILEEGLTVGAVVRALEAAHPRRRHSDTGCTEHLVSIGGESYKVVTGALRRVVTVMSYPPTRPKFRVDPAVRELREIRSMGPILRRRRGPKRKKW